MIFLTHYHLSFAGVEPII